jgi:hypothetical protein
MRALVRKNAAEIQGFLVALAVLITIVPAVANAAPPQEGPAEKAAVQKVVDGFIESLNAADVDSFISFFAPDATLFFPMSSLPLRLEDRQQIATAFGAFFEAVRRQQPGPPFMNLIPVGMRMQLFGSVAVVTFHLNGEDMLGRRTLVLQRRSGRWLIVHLHASSLPLQKQ